MSNEIPVYWIDIIDVYAKLQPLDAEWNCTIKLSAKPNNIPCPEDD